MPIHEIKNDEIKIGRIAYNCDPILGEKIAYPLANRCFAYLLTGPPRCGKTTLMLHFLCKPNMYKKVFKSVFYISASLASLKKMPGRYVPEVYFFEDLNTETMDLIFTIVEETAEEEENSLFICDDLQLRLKDPEVAEFIGDLMANRRQANYRISLILCTQNYNKVPLDCRNLISHLFMFYSRAKKEILKVYDEYNFLTKKGFDAVIKHCFKDKHDFIMFSREDGEIHRYHNYFSKIEYYETEKEKKEGL